MFDEFESFATAHWRDISGNVKWDIIKWACAFSTTTTGAVGLYSPNMISTAVSILLLVVGAGFLVLAIKSQFLPGIAVKLGGISQGTVEVVVCNRSKDEVRINRVFLRGLDRHSKLCSEVGSVYSARINKEHIISFIIPNSPSVLDDVVLPGYSTLYAHVLLTKATLAEHGATDVDVCVLLKNGQIVRSRIYGMGDLSTAVDFSTFTPPKLY